MPPTAHKPPANQLRVEHEQRERGAGPKVEAGPLSELRVVDVRFRYRAGPRVLDGASLELRRGEVVGLVGANGSGKTTLARVVAGLLAPEAGTVLWNGTPCAELDLSQQLIVLPQDFGRYWLTVAENVTLGLARSESEVQAALRAGGIIEAIATLEDGLDTMLAPELGGTDLSTGQWQRLALARTLLRDASLVILDEPTAALDPPSERRLYEDVRWLFADRAVLLVSHRLTGVQHADRIAVMVAGAIREVGTHHELLDRRGAYARLWGMQDPELQPASAS